MENLLNDIINGKHNITLFIIIIFLLFHIYYKIDQIKEPMAETDITDQIKQAVKQVYMADVEAIRNLTEVAIKLQKEGLTIPGNLTVTGNITVGSKNNSNGNITLINKQGGSGLFLSPNHENQGGSIYFYAPENPEGKMDFKNRIHYNSSSLTIKGMVVAWAGQDNAVPDGWALCDGKNGTPDLRGRFVLAAGQGDKLKNRVSKEIGGEENVVLTIDQMPAHTHTHNAYNANFKHHGDPTEGSTKPDCCGSFKVTSDPTGKNQPHNNMPPFYVLAYIMKL